MLSHLRFYNFNDPQPVLQPPALYTLYMAKSTRSKVKRSFRSKKRETGVYAATEAARLNRLNAKLISVASKDKDGDALIEDAEENSLGWCWFTVFGLLDADAVTAETMGSSSDSRSAEDTRKTSAEALTEPYPGTMKENCFDPVPDILKWMDDH